MRYRRVSYRYALLVTPNQDQAFGGPLVAAQPRFAETFWRPPSDVCESATTAVPRERVPLDLEPCSGLTRPSIESDGRRRLGRR